MVKFRAVIVSLLVFGSALASDLPKKPKLILAIVVDQFRYDYLLRFGNDYTAGFRQILDRGAIFEDAHHIHFPTVTATGHSTLLSGATPAMSGIIGNDWYDREFKKNEGKNAAPQCGALHSSVCDDQTTLVGGVPGAVGSSPRRLLVSTLGDEIKTQRQRAKVIGISIKDRGAILPVGHLADAAYWYDADSNRWVTSSYYMESLPSWVQEINGTRPFERVLGAEWRALDARPQDKPFCSMVAGLPDTRYCGSLEATPWGNELIEEFAERALLAENLGHHDGTDVLAISFSSNDYVGHAVGPDAPEVRDISIRTDRLLGKLLAEVDRRVGLSNVTFVLTSDHGVAPLPPSDHDARNMPGGRINDVLFARTIETGLTARYGPGTWIAASVSSMIYLNHSLIEKYKLKEADVDRAAAEIVRKVPHVFRVYTWEEMAAGQLSNDAVGRALSYGFYGPRSGNLLVVLDPYYLFEATGTSHGTPFNYDTHVPVIFMGAGIKPGHYYQKIAVNDIAPTLAAIAGVAQPSGSIGRVLQELWQ